MQASRLSKGFEACIGVLIPSVCLCACACVPLPLGGADGAQQPLHPRRQQAPPQHLLGGTSRACRLISPHHHKSAKSAFVLLCPPLSHPLCPQALIFDEAHKLKRDTSQFVEVLKSSVTRGVTICLTGTPLQNNTVRERADRKERESLAAILLACFMPLLCAMYTHTPLVRLCSVCTICIQFNLDNALFVYVYAGGVLHAAQRVQQRPLWKQSRLPTEVWRDQGTRRFSAITYTHICI